MARRKVKDSAEVAAAEALTSERGKWDQRVNDAVKRLGLFGKRARIR